MKYTFKLEPLLNYKKRLEEVAQQALAKKIAELAAARQAMERLQAARQEYLREIMKTRGQGIPAPQYLLYVDYLKTLERKIERQVEEIQGLDQAVAVARQKLLQVSREKKTIEKVRERDFRAFMQEAARLEQKQNDELVILRRQGRNPFTGRPRHA